MVILGLVAKSEKKRLNVQCLKAELVVGLAQQRGGGVVSRSSGRFGANHARFPRHLSRTETANECIRRSKPGRWTGSSIVL
jgi:hypothetical protein